MNNIENAAMDFQDFYPLPVAKMMMLMEMSVQRICDVLEIKPQILVIDSIQMIEILAGILDDLKGIHHEDTIDSKFFCLCLPDDIFGG